MDARTFLENQIQVLGITKKSVSGMLGCSGSTISDYIGNVKELKFLTAIKSIDSLFDGDDTFIKKYCLESEKPENIKSSMEYLSTNRHLNELRSLIYRCDTLGVLKDWSDTYKIVLNMQSFGKSYDELLTDIQDARQTIKDIRLRTMLEIIEANVHHRLYESSSFSRLIRSAESKLADMKEDFLKKSLSVRVTELKSQEALFVKNDVKLAREYAKEIISSKTGTKFVADANNIIGTSYMYENMEKSLKYIEKSIKQLRKINCHEVADSYEYGTKRLIKTYWDEELTEEDPNIQKSELAFMLGKRGDKEQAVKILDSIDQTPFRLYYRGVAENDPMIHFRALGEFIRRNELFYAQLPFIELSKHKEYKEAVKNLLN